MLVVVVSVVVDCCVVLLLICCWVVGLLGCWVVGLLGCRRHRRCCCCCRCCGVVGFLSAFGRMRILCHESRIPFLLTRCYHDMDRGPLNYLKSPIMRVI